MTDRQGGPEFRVNTGLLVTGAALAGIGSMLGFAGLTISGVALAVATRRWLNERGLPPADVARQQWAKARAATAAGTSAWRDSAPAASGRGSSRR